MQAVLRRVTQHSVPKLQATDSLRETELPANMEHDPSDKTGSSHLFQVVHLQFEVPKNFWKM